MAVMPNMDRDRKDRPTARPRMTSRAGGRQDSGAGERFIPGPPMPPIPPRPPFPMPPGDEAQPMPYRPKPRFGGSIPSPRQSYEMPSRRPSSAGGNRDAMIRAYMARMQPEGISQEEIDMYNRPAMDINDAFFGPDRKRFDVVEFLMGLMGRR